MSVPSEQAKALFLEATERHAPEEWPAFLDQACAGDAELRSAVDRLLRAREKLGSFHENAGPILGETVDARENERPGTVIGSYKLVEEIGEGGMGTVFLAQQSEPVRRVVALKVIKAGMDTRQVIARFEAERQALALMDHPNIAKVLDAGTTPAGRPYFVMELVKGIPITKYCDEKRLPPRERLELFLPVCQAIQHAHQKGIIHRDIKPTNVLVALYDGKPVPKVIDFGVAKAAGQPLTEKTLVTRLGAVVGTPEYMSPEQAELNQLDVDTRSDVYSLGVLLYELLTGTTPLKHKRVKEAALLEVLRIIREEEPQRPSTRLSTTAELPSIAANRGLEPKKLSGLIRGELDWIVMKALEKDRDRRYETANGLGRDIERYLHDEPVQACPPSAAYRLRKLVRRNKGPALVATALVTVLVAVALGATIAAFREQRLKREAEESAKSAQESADSERAARQDLERTLYFERIALADQRLAADHRDQVEELLEQCPERFRGWEWRYLKHWLQADPCVELRGHTRYINCVAFHPDGRRLASLAADGTVRIWDRMTGKQARPPMYGHAGIRAVAFSPDGKYLAAAGNDRTVKIRDADTGRLIRSLQGHEGAVLFVGFSPDNRLVASTSMDQTVRIWEAATGTVVHICSGKGLEATGVAFSPDGSRLALGTVDGAVRFWDVLTGQETSTWRNVSGSGGGILAFSPDGQHLAVSIGQYVHIRAVADGRLEHALQGHYMPLEGLAYSPDGRRLATASWDNTAKLWDTDSGREILTFRGHTDVVRGIAFSPDGRFLATGSYDLTVRVWDATGATEGAGGLLRTIPTVNDRSDYVFTLTHPSCHPDGRRVAVKSKDGSVRVWDVVAAKEVAVFRLHDLIIWATAFSPDGSRLTAGDVHGDVKVWDVATGQELWAGPGTGIAARGLTAFSPDNRLLACGGVFGGLTVRDGSTFQPIQKLGWTGDVLCMDFSRDGRLFAASGITQVKVWNTNGFKELWPLAQPAAVLNLRFSPDGRRLATGGNDRIVRLWDMETGKEVFNFPGHNTRVTCVDFSPDGRLLASAGGTEALVWSAADGRVMRRLRAHAGMVLSARFSPDGNRLITSGDDGTLRVWDVTLSPLDWHGAEARKLVNERFAKLLLRDDVVASLRADKALGDEFREVAVQLAEEHDEDPKLLDDAVWPVVKERGGDPAAYRLALRRQEAACRLFPERGPYVSTLGLAHFRLGQYKEAEATLQTSERLNALLWKDPWPPDLALRALLQLQDGRREEARATVARLHETLKLAPNLKGAVIPTVLRELEALLDQKAGDDPQKLKP